MERRRSEREREIESDERDRLKEKEELEELKAKIFAEGHSDPTATLKQVYWLRCGYVFNEFLYIYLHSCAFLGTL